ncbi:hypothetical protein FB45DRAFT_867586 [Roridomyces roridus]|uniref:Uncharacterized protein n=1 Tax=Roridomyces roridus TaxID=1738132 RepID=A0AAD7FMB6_9AGAR|nr:hypothetical protein FB45DRAFT_867586 [Roridomyces roridus]
MSVECPGEKSFLMLPDSKPVEFAVNSTRPDYIGWSRMRRVEQQSRLKVRTGPTTVRSSATPPRYPELSGSEAERPTSVSGLHKQFTPIRASVGFLGTAYDNGSRSLNPCQFISSFRGCISFKELLARFPDSPFTIPSGGNTVSGAADDTASHASPPFPGFKGNLQERKNFPIPILVLGGYGDIRPLNLQSFNFRVVNPP